MNSTFESARAMKPASGDTRSKREGVGEREGEGRGGGEGEVRWGTAGGGGREEDGIEGEEGGEEIEEEGGGVREEGGGGGEEYKEGGKTEDCGGRVRGSSAPLLPSPCAGTEMVPYLSCPSRLVSPSHCPPPLRHPCSPSAGPAAGGPSLPPLFPCALPSPLPLWRVRLKAALRPPDPAGWSELFIAPLTLL